MNLAQEIIEIELILGNLLLKTLCLFLVILLLCTFHQRHDITHAENTVRHTRRVELVNSIQFFTGTHKLDRLVHNSTDRKGGTTTGITVQLGQHYTVKVQTFIKLTGCIHRILTGHGIDHKQCFIRIDRFLDRLNLIHHLLVDSQTTGCIDNDQIITFRLRFMNSVQCYLHRILAVQFAIYRNFDLLSQDPQLFDSSGTINVTSHQQRLTVLLGFQHTGQFTGESSLTGTLQT